MAQAAEFSRYESHIQQNLTSNIESLKLEASCDLLKHKAIQLQVENLLMKKELSTMAYMKNVYESTYGPPGKLENIAMKFSTEIDEFFEYLNARLPQLIRNSNAYTKLKQEEEEKEALEELEVIEKRYQKFMELEEIKQVEEKKLKALELEKILEEEKEALRKLEEEEWKSTKKAIILNIILGKESQANDNAEMVSDKASEMESEPKTEKKEQVEKKQVVQSYQKVNFKKYWIDLNNSVPNGQSSSPYSGSQKRLSDVTNKNDTPKRCKIDRSKDFHPVHELKRRSSFGAGKRHSGFVINLSNNGSPQFMPQIIPASPGGVKMDVTNRRSQNSSQIENTSPNQSDKSVFKVPEIPKRKNSPNQSTFKVPDFPKSKSTSMKAPNIVKSKVVHTQPISNPSSSQVEPNSFKVPEVPKSKRNMVQVNISPKTSSPKLNHTEAQNAQDPLKITDTLKSAQIEQSSLKSPNHSFRKKSKKRTAFDAFGDDPEPVSPKQTTMDGSETQNGNKQVQKTKPNDDSGNIDGKSKLASECLVGAKSLKVPVTHQNGTENSLSCNKENNTDPNNSNESSQDLSFLQNVTIDQGNNSFELDFLGDPSQNQNSFTFNFVNENNETGAGSNDFFGGSSSNNTKQKFNFFE